MMWTAIIIALTICAGFGVFLGAYRAAQTGEFYISLIKIAAAVLIPEITKRKPEALEAEWRHDKATGGDTFKRKGGR